MKRTKSLNLWFSWRRKPQTVKQSPFAASCKTNSLEDWVGIKAEQTPKGFGMKQWGFIFSIDLEQRVAELPGEREVLRYSNSDVTALRACGLPALQRLVIVPVYMSRWQICGGISDYQQENKRAFWTVVSLSTEATTNIERGLVSFVEKWERVSDGGRKWNKDRGFITALCSSQRRSCCLFQHTYLFSFFSPLISLSCFHRVPEICQTSKLSVKAESCQLILRCSDLCSIRSSWLRQHVPTRRSGAAVLEPRGWARPPALRSPRSDLLRSSSVFRVI